MKIYTKTGDDGTTSLCDGKRVSKSSPRVNACGDIDELNSFLGLAASFTRNKRLVYLLQEVQHDLFLLASHTAVCDTKNHSKLPAFDEKKILKIESLIDEISSSLKPLKKFILPGGTTLASALHTARTICRRAERSCVLLAEDEGVYKPVIPYLNRLSDLLFVLARKANKGKDIFA